MTDVDQLIDIYYNKELWRKDFLSQEDIRQYFTDIIKKNRIIIIKDGAEITGYAESWRINKKQLFKFVTGQPFHVGEEDIETGNILVISSIWAKDTPIFNTIKRRLKEQNEPCEYGVWHKREGQLKIFKVPKRRDYGK
jgi:hypothetical protein